MKNASEYLEWRVKRSTELSENVRYKEDSLRWLNTAVQNEYSYMFQWMGVPIIQFPSDILLIQEAIFKSKVDKIVEIGIARGGMTLYLASLLKLMHEDSETAVIGVDIKISQHTRDAIVESNLGDRIVLIEGDSASKSTLSEVKEHINPGERVLVILDSNHTSEHVYKEMSLYADLVSLDSFLIVMDTAIEYLEPEVLGENRIWARSNSPQTAIDRFFRDFPDRFEVDTDLDSRALPGAAKGGYLRRK